jgi:predicted cupin superfamily sugar epimerase
MHPDARAWIDELKLVPHPEGGLYVETHRAPLHVATPQGDRSASTAIYFLLPAGSFSALHRVRSDEVWHHYDGDPVELTLLDPIGGARVVRLGRDRARGERPQVIVPAETFQAARPIGDRFALCGCTVAPGFVFDDFELPSRAELRALFPKEEKLVTRFTRT